MNDTTLNLSGHEAIAMGKARQTLKRAFELAEHLENKGHDALMLDGRWTSMMDLRLEFDQAVSRIDAATVIARREAAARATEDGIQREVERVAAALNPGELETLRCLCEWGPTSDGDVPSKAGRDGLVEKRLAEKVVMKGGREGYQAATNLGLRTFQAREQQAVRAALRSAGEETAHV